MIGKIEEKDKKYSHFEKIGENFLSFSHDFLTIFIWPPGSMADFMEAFKTFDREGQGFISAAELRHVIANLGERLSDEEVENILKWTDMVEDLDGNLKYEEFITKVMAGPVKK